MHEGGGGGLPGGTPMRTPSSEVIVFSVVYTLPICNPRIFSRLRTPGGGGDTPAAPCASIAATNLTLVFSILCATPLLPSPLFSRDCAIMSGRGGTRPPSTRIGADSTGGKRRNIVQSNCSSSPPKRVQLRPEEHVLALEQVHRCGQRRAGIDAGRKEYGCNELPVVGAAQDLF